MRTRLAAILGLVLPWQGPATPEPPPAATGDGPPNLVLFVVDDLGWQDTSVAFSGEAGPFQERFPTPHLAALARHGVRFADAHAQSVCTPSRLSMLTGLNSARHGCTNWVLEVERETSGQTEVLGPPPRWERRGWKPGTPTLPALLRERGYRTIHAGKAHFGAVGTPGADPLQLGFDVNIAGHAAGAPGSYQGRNGFDEPGRTTRGPWAVPGLERFHGTEAHLTDVTTALALEAVEAAVTAQRPFYLHLAHYAVHAPIEPHEPHVARFRELGYDETEARYASMVAGVDASLGALLAKLEALGVAERTLIVFTSDNGGLSVHARGTSAIGGGPDTHNAPLREGKGSAYEGGTRVPLLFAWARPAPESSAQRAYPLRAGALERTPTLCEDLFPTLLAAGGARAPHGLDGLDLAPLLAGSGTLAERALVFHHPHVWGPRGAGYQPHSSIRRGDLKAIYFYEPERWELYDLARDLSEQHDLAREQPEALRRLGGELVERLQGLTAAWPLERASGRERPIRAPR